MREVPENVRKLADYINQQERPREFMALLLALCALKKAEQEGDSQGHFDRDPLARQDGTA